MRRQQHQVRPSPCPSCGVWMDGATGITSDDRPDPGDLTICFYCVKVAVYDDDLTLRRPNAAEAAAAAANPKVIMARRVMLARKGAPWS